MKPGTWRIALGVCSATVLLSLAVVPGSSSALEPRDGAAGSVAKPGTDADVLSRLRSDGPWR